MERIKVSCSVALFLLPVLASQVLSAQATGLLRGQVLDPSGAAVPKASITATGPNAAVKTAESDSNGEYRIPGLAAGEYAIRASAPGFGIAENTVSITDARTVALNFRLTVAPDRQEVTVADQDQTKVDIDPGNNASAIVLKGDDLNILADNSTDLASDLQALAGPGAGPNGGQILVDGFSNAQLPPKESIREIRINSNPFSAEYDRSGMGRVEILTRPGTDKLRGSVYLGFADSALNARNPFATEKPPTRMWQYGANMGGRVTKKSSFTVDVGRNIQDASALIRAQVVNAAFEPVSLIENVLTPTSFTYFSPRFDYAVTPNLTLQGRYFRNSFENTNSGVGQFSLSSRGTNNENPSQGMQFTETQVIGARLINESRFFFTRNKFSQSGDGSSPAINVNGAFNGGGATSFNNYNTSSYYEFQNYSSYTRGRHYVRFGIRVRAGMQESFSMSNYNGSFTFPSMDSYILTLKGQQQGLTMEQIRAQGGGPQQYSVVGGTPLTNVNQWDFGPFVQEDFRYRPNLTISLGLRYEAQTNISDRSAWAPRIGVAWGIGRGQAGGRPPKTVLRLGWGVFYERINQGLTLQTLRQNGITQQNFFVNAPNFFPIAPPASALVANLQPQAIYKLYSGIEAPEFYQAAVTLERQLPKNITLSTTYTNTRGVHQLRSRNINAPTLTGFPLGTSGQLMLYESSALYRQNQLTMNVNARVNTKVSLFGFYNYSRTYSDSDGSASFPANNYNAAAEWSRSNNDVRHRSSIGGNLNLPFQFQLSPSLNLNSAPPVNITTGTDWNRDTNFNDRPAFATVAANPALGVIASPWGTFNGDPLGHPENGSVVIPRNYGKGFGFIGVFLRLSRTWTFGESAVPAGGAPPRGARPPGRYSINLGISARNALNRVNPSSPAGNLTSPFLGQAIQSSYGGNANRRLQLDVRFAF